MLVKVCSVYADEHRTSVRFVPIEADESFLEDNSFEIVGLEGMGDDFIPGTIYDLKFEIVE